MALSKLRFFKVKKFLSWSVFGQLHLQQISFFWQLKNQRPRSKVWLFYSFKLKVRKPMLFVEQTEAALQRFPKENLFWKYAANLQKNANAEKGFQKSCFAKFLLKSHFSMGVLL